MSRKLALLIGVGEYGEGFESLSAPPKDVAALQRVLDNPELGGFDQVKTLLDPNPTEMRIEIEELFISSTREDLILLFFSGHGITDDSFRLYLATRLSSKVSFRSTSVDARFIQDLSDGTYAKRQVIILDCCYSGAFAEGWQRKGDVKVELERELGKEGRVVLTSSSSTQVSFQQEEAELSLYTQYLIEGIETGAADADQDGVVKVRELHDYAKRKVREVKPKMQPDIIVADDEGYDIFLSRVKIDAALQFRRFVEECVDHERGEILDIDLETLEVRAQGLGLLPEQVNAIIDSVLEPFRRRRKNLNRYREKYAEYAEQQYPLDPRILKRLRVWQQEVLGLEDQDIAPIQEAINCEKSLSLAAARAKANQAQNKKPSETKSKPAVINEGNQANLQVEQSQKGDLLETFRFETAKITGVQKRGGFLGVGGQVDCEIKRESRTAECFIETLGNGVPLEMVKIPSGKFLMGSPESGGGNDRQRPQHWVTVPSFSMGKLPVRQIHWRIVAGFPKINIDLDPDPSQFKGANRPVEMISWHEAVEFCQRLSQHTGNSYRLPSEAEWEYACRAGTETPFHFGETITTDLANYDGNKAYGAGPKGVYRKETTVVGQFPANDFGIFDMHGNVWEWCLDHWHKNYQGAPTDGSAWITGGDESRRSLRGGSWFLNPRHCRSAIRNDTHPDEHYNNLGFRVVCSAA